MTYEVRSRLCNGQGNEARNVQTVHSTSPSLHPLAPLSLPLTCSSPDDFSASFIYALCHQCGVILAKINAKANCHLRSNIHLSLSFTFFQIPVFWSFSCLFSSSIGWLMDPNVESNKYIRDQLTGKNGKAHC